MTGELMRKTTYLLLPLLLLLVSANLQAKTWRVKPGKLEKIVRKASPGDSLKLREGRYELTPSSRIDTLCGNCAEAVTPHPITIGLLIDKPLHLVGESGSGTVIVTNAGYGLFFENAGECSVQNLTITGGVRDTSGMATDGGIVVRGSELLVQSVRITGNDNRAEGVIVGICGIVAREGANLTVRGNLIADNGWDGIALYRGARADIRGNIISGGRGVGVGITWDAVAEVRENEISGYWKGIGSFGTSTAIVRDNIVRDLRGWGIVATGESVMDCTHNVIARTGNCGFSVWSEFSQGRFLDNIVYMAGREEEWVCPDVGVWWNGPDSAFVANHNVIWGASAEAWRKSVWDDDPAAASTEPLENYAIAPDSSWSGLYCDLDPRFVDPEANDFTLAPDSPLRGQAVDIGHGHREAPSDIGLHEDALQLIQRLKAHYGTELKQDVQEQQDKE